MTSMPPRPSDGGLGQPGRACRRNRCVRRRIAGFLPDAVGAAKASVVRAEITVESGRIAETVAFDATLADDETHVRTQRFLDAGGQTPEGERRLGELAGELS